MEKRDKLELLRRGLKLSKKDFAEMLEINPTTLQMWYKNNRYDTETLLLKVKNLNLEWLLTGKGDMLQNGETSGFSFWDNNTATGGDHSVNISAGKNVHFNREAELQERLQRKCEVIKTLQNQLNAKDKHVEHLKEQINTKDEQIAKLIDKLP